VNILAAEDQSNTSYHFTVEYYLENKRIEVCLEDGIDTFIRKGWHPPARQHGATVQKTTVDMF
jgi:hypothetical protein